MSGMKKLVFNTQERAISPDVNRLQSFKEADVAELFRYALNVSGNDDLDAGSVIVEHTTLESPLRAEIINGLMVQPQGGALDLFVTPGVVYALSPDAAPDESNYKYVRDAGIGTLGTLVMTANGGGSPRIDVIECRINPVDLLVPDNRDIFNPVTGLFTATSVTKERSARLEYRVRAGTVGGGFASVGVVSGWLPLCVASVPAGAASVDAMTFWDVRPLISDRALNVTANTTDVPLYNNTVFKVDAVTAPATVPCVGYCDIVYKGRRVGGQMRRGTPGSDAAVNIIITDAANQSAGFAVAGGFVDIYLCFPFGLPRWARYTDGPAGRVPRSPRGIPVVSNVLAGGVRGTPSAAVPLPTSTGLGGSTTDAVSTISIPVFPGFGFHSCVVDGYRTYVGISPDGIPAPKRPTIVAVGVYDTVNARVTFTPGGHYPRHAKRVLVAMDLRITNGSGVQQNYYMDSSAEPEPAKMTWLEMPPPGVPFVQFADFIAAVPLSGSNHFGHAYIGQRVCMTHGHWLPLPQTYPPVAAPATQAINIEACVFADPGGAGSVNTPTFYVTIFGWEV